MEICLYEHECQLGDYVFADGSYSDRDNKTKTAVGLCVFIDDDEPTRRLAMTTASPSVWCWGLHSTNFPDIELKDTPGYSVYDIPTLTNKSNTGITGSIISDATFRDESSNGDGQGFKILDKNSVCGEIGWTESDVKYGKYNEGDMLPWGLINTLKIINHRNIILQDSNINLPLPQMQGNVSEYNNLLQLMSDIVAANGNDANYRQYYYPAASLCHHYEPSVKDGEKLADCLKAGHWFLPSAGELARIYWYHSKGYELGIEHAIFARAVADGRMSQLGAAQYKSSTEQTAGTAWYIGFPSGQFNYGNNGKNTSHNVIAMVAF